VALFALQFCLALEANVFVTSSSQEKIDRAVALGATSGVRYDGKQWTEDLLNKASSGFNVVIDSSGGSTLNQLLSKPRLLQDGCNFVIYGATNGISPDPIPIHQLFLRNINVLGTMMGSSREFSSMMRFIEKHRIRPVIDMVFRQGLEHDYGKAFDRLRRGNQFGKIVMSIDASSSMSML
jgi:zinc-binding alcohol dehydrogenase/oxidoreductase